MAEENSPVLGLHLEGPYFNPKQAGDRFSEWIKAPVPEEYEPLLDKYSCIKRWDEAPELPGSVEFIQWCRKHGVVASIGHTRATYEDVVAGHKAGMMHATHFYNAMPVVYKEHEFKVPGTVESVYALPDMTIELIADGIHVPPVMLKVAYKIKGVEKTALITRTRWLVQQAKRVWLSTRASSLRTASASWLTILPLPDPSPLWTALSAPVCRWLAFRWRTHAAWRAKLRQRSWACSTARDRLRTARTPTS